MRRFIGPYIRGGQPAVLCAVDVPNPVFTHRPLRAPSAPGAATSPHPRHDEMSLVAPKGFPKQCSWYYLPTSHRHQPPRSDGCGAGR